MRSRRRPLHVTALVAALLTAGAVVVDVARPQVLDPARGVVADVTAPVRQALTGWDEGRVRALTAERDALAAEVARLREQVRRHEQLGALDDRVVDDGHRLLPARVVGFSPGTSPVAGRTVTIDVGADDGVSPDLTVVAADGLVGRVLRVAGSSADVLLVGDAGVVVGVRYGTDGALGSVAAEPPPGLPPRGQGELTLTALGDTVPRVGDEVTTLGSPDDRPYVAGVALGVVRSPDPDRGQLGSTAVVRPHVDTDTLDLVAVVLPEGEGQAP
ncbi:rod shape-determining protein MreC [Ornithinimicrobium sp. W1679]|uniref:rod shape-determining protein MreC n=1 Tax=Ornithinimicrobium sp. W1679 TaxID=3418770 RepID=UPI003CF0A39E